MVNTAAGDGNPSPARAERLELHNASIDEILAAAGACAHIHLATGRICRLDHTHRGSCQFSEPDPAE